MKVIDSCKNNVYFYNQFYGQLKQIFIFKMCFQMNLVRRLWLEKNFYFVYLFILIKNSCLEYCTDDGF